MISIHSRTIEKLLRRGSQVSFLQLVTESSRLVLFRYALTVPGFPVFVRTNHRRSDGYTHLVRRFYCTMIPPAVAFHNVRINFPRVIDWPARLNLPFIIIIIITRPKLVVNQQGLRIMSNDLESRTQKEVVSTGLKRPPATLT